MHRGRRRRVKAGIQVRVLIVKNMGEPKTFEAAIMLGVYFTELGIRYDVIESTNLVDDSTLMPHEPVYPEPYDLCVVLGGDGTILRTLAYLGETDTPYVAINYGHLGFLANPADDGVVRITAAALAGDVTEERRANIVMDVDFGEDAPAPPEGLVRRSRFFALNEVTVERGVSGRIVDMDVYCDGTLAYKSRGNGMVVASATGSTAYTLSAGGPLVSPEMRGLVVVPLAAHTLNSRAMVTAPGEVVELVMSGDEWHSDVRLFLDGRPLEFDVPVRAIRVRNSEYPTRLLRYNHKGFYDDVSRVFFREK